MRSGLDKNIPLILKLSPDEENLERVIEESLFAEIDGWCLTNSTRQRPVPDIFPADRGGVSGQLLAPLSLSMLKRFEKLAQENKIGRQTCDLLRRRPQPSRCFSKIRVGADLVQVYSALVFQGYSFFHSVSKAHSSKF